MSLLIDGYNLLNVAGILPSGRGPNTLERARLALLNFLAESLDPKHVSRTTVVFDANNAPPGLPRVVNYRGLTVRFASRYPDADSLIEELIETDSSPRRLLVVSSDHRLQRAARRRRAKSMDADVWYAQTVHQRQRRLTQSKNQPARPPVPLLEEEVNYWLRQFGGEAAFKHLLEEDRKPGQEPGQKPAKDASAETTEEPRLDKKQRDAGLGTNGDAFNPFPPGYGEDLEE